MKNYSVRHTLHNVELLGFFSSYSVNYYPKKLENKKEDLYIGCQSLNSDKTLNTLAEILGYDLHGIKKTSKYKYSKQNKGTISFRGYSINKKSLPQIFKFLCMIKGIEIFS